jgi:hypothetical protein
VAVLSEGARFLLRRPGESIYDLLARLVGPQFGLSAGEVEAALKDVDSLDLVEFTMEMEQMIHSGRP